MAQIRNLAAQIAPTRAVRRCHSAASPCNTPQYKAVQRLYKSLRSGCHAASSHLPSLDFRFRGLTDSFRTSELHRISAELKPVYFSNSCQPKKMKNYLSPLRNRVDSCAARALPPRPHYKPPQRPSKAVGPRHRKTCTPEGKEGRKELHQPSPKG